MNTFVAVAGCACLAICVFLVVCLEIEKRLP